MVQEQDRDLNVARSIGSADREPLTARNHSDRRWCSERRTAERRVRVVPVAVERRQVADRRSPVERRLGIDRRGNFPVKTGAYHRCSEALDGERQCGQPAVLRATSGWRCFWHLDRTTQPRPDLG